MNQRSSPSGAPVSFNPTHLPETIGFLHADCVQRVGTDVIGAYDLAGGALFTLNPASTSAPQAVVVEGRQRLRFGGNGVSLNVGSWLQSSDPELVAAWRYLTSQGDFYFAATYQAPLLGGGQQILVAASNAAVSNQWLGLITNLDASNWRARWYGQNGGAITPNMVDQSPPDAGLHLVEVVAETRKPTVSNPGTYQSLRIDAEPPVEQHAATMNDFGELSVMTIGAVERSGSFDNSFGGDLRAAVWCLPCPPLASRIKIRDWLREDAGLWPL